MREDWIETSLGDIYEIVTGNTPSKKDKGNYGGEIPFIKPPDINNSPLSSASEYLSAKGASKGRVLPAQSVLVTCIGKLGRVTINKEPIAFNQQINALKPLGNIHSRFTYYVAQSGAFRNQLEAKSTSTTVALVNKGSFSAIKIPLAPLPEQRAIVAKIEELFSDLDKGIADLKRAQDQLKVYRQAVLKKAFEGDLTKEWRGEKRLTKNDWKFPPLGDILIQSKEKHKPDNVENLFYVGLEHIEKETGNLTETVGMSEIKTVKNKFKTGQILYGKLRPYLNKVYLAKESGVCSTDILVFDLEDSVIGKFAVQFMLSRQFVNDMSANTNGVNLPRVSTKYVNNYKFPLPSTKEQHLIVQEIESRLSVCDKVEESIMESLEKAKALRQSILKKAFEGTLLSEEEIAACKAAPDYEPASVLLKRLKKEKDT